MQFVAFERAKQGTGASRRLRNTGRTPGIVFGGETPAATIELDHNALWHALKKEAFHSSILEMDVAGSVQKVLLRDVQYQGSATRYELQLDNGQLLAVTQANDRWQAQPQAWQPGQRVQAHWPREAMTVLQESAGPLP